LFVGEASIFETEGLKDSVGVCGDIILCSLGIGGGESGFLTEQCISSSSIRGKKSMNNNYIASFFFNLEQVKSETVFTP